MQSGAQCAFHAAVTENHRGGKKEVYGAKAKVNTVRLHLHKDRLGIWGSILRVRNKDKSICIIASFRVNE